LCTNAPRIGQRLRQRHAGVVDEHVETAETFVRLGDAALDRDDVRDVRANE
jgi:hypothetical protein